MNPSQTLKNLLSGKETLVMPDAYDPISARIIEAAGFKAVQCSGYSFSVAACRKQEIDVGLEENVASLIQEGRLCSGQDIGRLIGA